MLARSAPLLLLLLLLLVGACTPTVPARVKERPIEADSTCRDSYLLHIDPDNCQWKRIDGATEKEEILVDDTKYCSSYDISVHPTEPRLFAHLMPDDDRKPDVVREISVAEGVVRTVSVPRDVYIEYSGYDEKGRLTVLVSDELPEPSRAVQLVYDLLERETCVASRARALVFDGKEWKQSAAEISDCGNSAPAEALNKRLLAPMTMAGTTTLVDWSRVGDTGLLDRLASAMDDAEYPPAWREQTTPHGRVVRGADDYGGAFWIAFTDKDGRVVGKPAYDDNTKLRMRGAYLLTTSEGESEENGRLYDMTTGALLWEADSYSATVFWPCPTTP